MKSVILAGILTVVTSAFAAESNSSPAFKSAAEIETSCRIKAKEIAAETYRGCVTDQKSSQIEQIKKEYAEKLNALKAHYEQELKKMSSQAKAKAEAAAPAVAEAPAKKAKPAQVTAKAKTSTKKAAEVVSKSEDKSTATSEMTVQLKAAPGEPAGDESILDLPEPIPVEEPSFN